MKSDPPAGYLPAEWIIARTIDREYRVEHGEVMPVSELERRLTERGQSVDRATLERWRKVRHYWADPAAEE